MTTRTALVTGATGCLGRHLIQRLTASGWTVRANGRNRQIGQLITEGNVLFVAADLRDQEAAASLTVGVDTVFHCAALSSPWGPADDFRSANVDATRYLLDAARSAGCRRFVHVSSPSIYFAYRDALAIPETGPLPKRFVNAYAASKVEAEQLVLTAGREGLRVTILRPRGIFGEFDTALGPRLKRFAETGRVPLLRRGQALVDVSYAGNVADAMLLAAAPNAPSGVFNITNDEPLTVRDLLVRTFDALGQNVRFVEAPYHLLSAVARVTEATARAFNLSEPKLLPYTLGVMAYSQTLDITAAKTQLGYQPRVSIDDGLARYAAWLNTAETVRQTETGTAVQ